MRRLRLDAVIVVGALLPTLPFVTQPVLGEGGIRATFYLLSGALLASFGALFYGQRVPRVGPSRRGTARANAAGAMVCIATVGALWVGLWRGNPIPSVVGDVFRGVSFGLAIVLGGRLRTSAEVSRAIHVAWTTLVVVECARLVMFTLWLASGTYLRFSSGSNVSLTIAIGILLGYVSVPAGRSPHLLRYTICPWIVGLNAATSLSRSAWLGAVVCVALFGLHRVSLRFLVRAFTALVSAVVVVAAVFATTQLSVEDALVRRFNETLSWDTETDSSFTSRSSENESALEALSELDTGTLLGGGLGFEYFDAAQDLVVHQIHNTYISVFVRHGAVLGVLLFVVLARVLVRSLRGIRRTDLAIVPVAWLVGLFGAYFLYSVIGDPVLGVFAGIVLSGVLRKPRGDSPTVASKAPATWRRPAAAR